MDKKQNKTKHGQLLKQTRESKNISLETVQEATKIPLDALRAIEEGYTVRTLSTFYYWGFVKIYAKFLGIDVREVIENYQPEKLPQPISVDKTKETKVYKKLKFPLTQEILHRVFTVAVVILLSF